MSNIYADSQAMYRRLGYCPIPAKGKRPSARGYNHAADLTDADYERMAAQHKADNIGLSPHGFIVLDVDAAQDHNRKNADGVATFDALQKELGPLPTTWTNTARGKDSKARHYLYRIPDQYQGCKADAKTGKPTPRFNSNDPGIDMICEGTRHILVYPSIHPQTGSQYRWYDPQGNECGAPALAELPTLPDKWLRHFLKPDIATVAKPRTNTPTVAINTTTGDMCKSVTTALGKYFSDPASKGSRHDTARDAMHKLARMNAEGHHGAIDAIERIHPYYISLVAQSRDGGEREAEAEWQRMCDGVQAQIDARPNTEDPCLTYRSGRRNTPTPNARATQNMSTPLTTVFTMSELMGMRFKPPTPLIPGIVVSGTILLVAPPKIGKSWMCLDLGYQLATGGRAFGSIPLTSRPVLYMALEDGPRRLRSRLETLGHTQPAPLLSFVTQTEDPEANLMHFMEKHKADKPTVILDTLGKVLALYPRENNEGAYEHDYRVLGGLQSRVMAYDGASLLMVHHNNKSRSGDFVDTVNGTNGIAGSADAIMKLDRKRGDNNGLLQVTSRDSSEGEYAMTFQDGLWTLDGDTIETAQLTAGEVKATMRSGTTLKTVLALVKQHPEGIRPYQIAEETTLTAQVASNYLQRLAKQNAIENVGRGVYRPFIPHESGEYT